MSLNHRTRNGNAARTQPSILRARKRKGSENESHIPLKCLRRSNEMPLEDVTTSLNVKHDCCTDVADYCMPTAWDSFRDLTCYPTPSSSQNVPLPNLTWADKSQVWELMCQKEKNYNRNPDYLSRHPALQPRMRSILFDWLTEVCEVYKLHRETYYLSADYIDRYLSASADIPKQQLQLIEIYPPKIGEFAFVTDGACTDREILDEELVILKTLNWDLSPLTTNGWLNTYLQLYNTNIQESFEDIKEIDAYDFIFPSYSGLTFVQVARLLDLCTLDISSLAFSASKMAASALCYFFSPKIATHVSGYSMRELHECYDWMAAFAITIRDASLVPLRSFSQVHQDDVHNIQTHSVDLETLEMAQIRLNQIGCASWRRSPPVSQPNPSLLTPPKTDEKKESS